jgi:hypothetical protein
MAKDLYHNVVRRALEAESWQITHDPLTLKYGEQTSVYVDLGAETPLAAEKEGQKIAVEIKSFLSPSPVTEMEKAIGQFGFYRFLLARQHPGRVLYLAMPEFHYEALFDTSEGRDLAKEMQLKFLIYDIEAEMIIQWIE